MSDPRLTPANARVMAAHLGDDGSGRTRVTAKHRQIAVPLIDLLRRPDGPRDRQLLLGDLVDVYEADGETSFVQARKDGYVGYVPTSALAPVQEPTHTVSAPATHAYTNADLKSSDRHALSFGCALTVTAVKGSFAQTPVGFVPTQHLRPLTTPQADPLVVAELFLGTPYLWGGNSRSGIDCSGLVQAACLACHIPCPGDSDQQEQNLGRSLPDGTAYERGDLLFWKGHVAWVASDTTLIHANAHHMATCFEDITATINRIQSAGDGPVTAHKRLLPKS